MRSRRRTGWQALPEVRLTDLEGENYLNRANCEYKDFLRDLRERQGVQIRYMYASERDDWIQCMVLAGLGFTLIPEYAVTVPGLVTRPLVEPEVVRHVNLVTVRGRPHSPAVGAFVHEFAPLSLGREAARAALARPGAGRRLRAGASRAGASAAIRAPPKQACTRASHVKPLKCNVFP